MPRGKAAGQAADEPRAFRDRIVELRRVPASDLRPNPRNWRRHPDHQRKALASMLEEVGFAGAALARETPEGLELIDGHLRAEVSEEVPVLVLDVTEAEAELLLATFDPLGAMAQTDEEGLWALLASVEVPDKVLARALEQLTGKAGKPEGLTDPDDVPEPPGNPITRPGDLWVLGEHRLLCGDATDPASVERLLGGAIPNVMATDPPYGVGYDPSWREEEARKGNLWYAPHRLGEVPNDDRVDWTEAYALFPGDVAYVWHAALFAGEVAEHLRVAGFELRSEIIWAKPYAPISRGHYNWQHEPCWYAVRKGATASWSGDAKATTLWESTPVNEPYKAHASDEDTITNHGAQKPIMLYERAFANHGDRGDTVYDPFVGSGTALIAAERTGRRCYAMDIDPTYADVAVKRWESYTGRTAERA